ncbi:MAG TPA: hypothetical protein VFL47_00470 [Flavisolibacter sp.]|nr:hypothetical protein [Flavisolibacter sp.]
MAKLRPHSLLNALQGKLGDEIIFKHYANKIVVSKYPDMSRVKPSPLQQAYRNRMKEANAYARAVKRDPERTAAYERILQPGENVYRKAVKAFMNGTSGTIA